MVEIAIGRPLIREKPLSPQQSSPKTERILVMMQQLRRKRMDADFHSQQNSQSEFHSETESITKVKFIV